MYADLLHSSDEQPGYTRMRQGAAFVFVDKHGRELDDDADLARVKALAIPPAYEQVWICPHQRGHIQATARDARGRKQYIYHPVWRELRDQNKFDRMVDFGEALPRIRRRMRNDLARPGLVREKILAAVCLLLDQTLVRVGNEEYAQANKSFGLTTLRNRHVRVKKSMVRFEFRGKSAVEHSIAVNDPMLAKIVRKCLDIPGQHLFQYVGDDGKAHRVDSDGVNQYLKSISGMDITAKDFRTWAASAAALGELSRREFSTKTEATRQVAETIRQVAQQLRNTPAVCRKSYIHPAIVDAYRAQTLDKTRSRKQPRGLRVHESHLLRFLQSEPGR